MNPSRSGFTGRRGSSTASSAAAATTQCPYRDLDELRQRLAAEAPITGGEKALFAVGVTLWVSSSAWMVLWVFVLAGSAPLVDVV